MASAILNTESSPQTQSQDCISPSSLATWGQQNKHNIDIFSAHKVVTAKGFEN